MQPKVGDTVILEAIVTTVLDNGDIKFRTPGGPFSYPMSPSRFKQIIRKFVEAGDTVRVKDDILPDYQYTVLAVHGSGTPLTMPYGPTRRWAVCVHGDDIPVVINVGNLTCVD